MASSIDGSTQSQLMKKFDQDYSLPEIDLPAQLSNLKRKGWIPSDRKGDTAIGKTIEDNLGIKENNLGEPDCTYHGIPFEIKGHRIRTKSMVTLFTLEPKTRKLNDVQLMRKYGYKNGNGRQALKITLTTDDYTPQRLKLETTDDSIRIVDMQGNTPWIWTLSDIQLKLHNLCIIYADSLRKNGREYLAIQKALLVTGLDEKCFFGLVESAIVKIDLRMHIKETGASRNHGTAFRILNIDSLTKCYAEREWLRLA